MNKDQFAYLNEEIEALRHDNEQLVAYILMEKNREAMCCKLFMQAYGFAPNDRSEVKHFRERSLRWIGK